MHHMPTVACVIVLSVLASRPACSRADELAERGRDIFKKNQRAVITVQIVMKLKFSVPGLGGQANESKQDLTGTVVDPSGLTVLALSSCEPADMFQNMMAGMSDEETKFKMDTELSDIKLLLDDGTELPADIVLRDKDLDLAFIRPKTRPASPMLALDLSKAATAQILDQVITHPKFVNADYTTKFIDETPELFKWEKKRDRATRILSFMGEVIVKGGSRPTRPQFAGLHPGGKCSGRVRDPLGQPERQRIWNVQLPPRGPDDNYSSRRGRPQGRQTGARGKKWRRAEGRTDREEIGAHWPLRSPVPFRPTKKQARCAPESACGAPHLCQVGPA